MPDALTGWEGKVEQWCGEYASVFPEAEFSEIHLDFSVFLFDHAFERVLLAYAVSVEQLMQRDSTRMRGFPDVNVGVEGLQCCEDLVADKGHFLGHASGGVLDINLFPHRRELNRGWSREGKRFRGMEKYVAEHLGTFFYHRPIYDDETWIPTKLEYGVLREDREWWIGTFQNK